MLGILLVSRVLAWTWISLSNVLLPGSACCERPLYKLPLRSAVLDDSVLLNYDGEIMQNTHRTLLFLL